MFEMSKSLWLSIGFPILLAVVSMVVTILYGMRKRLTYQRRSFGLVFGGVNKLPGMEIRYHGHGPSVENLTVSRIAIWNAGRGDVRKSDILGKPAPSSAATPTKSPWAAWAAPTWAPCSATA